MIFIKRHIIIDKVEPNGDKYFCIDCGKEVQPMDIPLCDKCAKQYDLERLWNDHDRQGYPEPWDFIENSSIRNKYRNRNEGDIITPKEAKALTKYLLKIEEYAQAEAYNTSDYWSDDVNSAFTKLNKIAKGGE